MTCPMPLQRWHTMLMEQFDEALVETTFFCGWDCIEDTLLTSEVGVVVAVAAAGNVAGGLATGALDLSMSGRCGKDFPELDLKDCCCRRPCTSRSALRAR